MSRVKGRDTKPEREVRSLAHKLGFRFRLGNRNLPGKPDLTFARFKKVVFVHGCFWHGHNCRNTKPRQNRAFWLNKIARNRARDREVTRVLRNRGWRVFRIWECQISKQKIPLSLIKLLK